MKAVVNKFQNYKQVDLRNLNNEDLSLNKMILKDDVWHDNTLLLKRGTPICESITRKLLNFGIQQINIFWDDTEAKAHMAAREELVKNFLGTQNALILSEKNDVHRLLARKLNLSGISQHNIYTAINFDQAINIIINKKPSYIFTSAEQFLKNSIKFTRAYNLISFTHIFIVASEDFQRPAIIKEIENKSARFNAKVLTNPVLNSHIREVIISFAHQDYKKLFRKSTQMQLFSGKIIA